MVKSSYCSSLGPGFDSQHNTGGLQPFLTSVSEDPILSSCLPGNQACMWYTNVHVDKIPINTEGMNYNKN